MLAQLELTDATGWVHKIGTDDEWLWSNDGPIQFADNKDGEEVDARKTAVFNNHAIITKYHIVPTASNNVAIKEKERFVPKLIRTPSRKIVLDFEQNIAGYVELKLQAKSGQTVFLRFGEMLDDKGEFTQKNIQCSNDKITTPKQQVRYFCKEGENDYKTKFAIFGFRYVELETEVAFLPENFTAIAVYSDMEETIKFESSNHLLNQLKCCSIA